jgi:hypothetical protein
MPDTRALIQTFGSRLERQEFVEAFSMLNEDGRYIIIGNTPISGAFNGRQDLLGRLIPLIAERFVVPPKLTVSHILVDGKQGFLRAAGSGKEVGINGPYRQPYYGWYFRAAGDGFAELIEYFDTVQIETALFGRKLVET